MKKMFGFGKKKIVTNLQLEGVTPEKLPPLPPPPAITKPSLGEEIIGRLDSVLVNQQKIYDAIISLRQEEVVTLDNDELKFIPEEDKAEYFEMKKNNPKMAEKILLVYKGEKKGAR